MALEDGEDKCIIVVTPLNLLGKQNVEVLKDAGISAVAINASNTMQQVFELSICRYSLNARAAISWMRSSPQEVKNGAHRVIVLNPELIMQECGHCEELWVNPAFIARLLYVVFDEEHCVKEWSPFREQYKYMSTLTRGIGPCCAPEQARNLT